MLSPSCKVLGIVISYLIFWSICLSCSFVDFKNDSEYFTRELARHLSFIEVSAAKMSFEKLSRSFYVLFSYFYSFISFCLMVSVLIFPNTCNFLFLEAFRLFLICQYCSFRFFSKFSFRYIWLYIVHFSMRNSILKSWLYIFIIYFRVTSSLSFFFANSLLSSFVHMVMKVFLQFCGPQVCNWVASLLLLITVVRASLPGFSLPQKKSFFLLLISFSSFSWFAWWSLWICTF